jgi:hypothetical protein
MVNTTLLYFLLLVPLSGFIAWAGDKIGHKIGKKRQTLFGLRPRHTATVITIAAGVGITLTSFLVTFLASASFRDSVLRGNQLKTENAALLRGRDQLQATIQETTTKVNQLQVAARQAESDRISVEQRRVSAEKHYQQAQQQLRSAQKNLSIERTSLTKTQSTLTKAEKQLRSAQSALTEAAARRVAAASAAKNAEQRLIKTQDEAASARSEVATARRVFQQVTEDQRKRLGSRDSALKTLNEKITLQEALLSKQQGILDTQSAQAERQKKQFAQLSRDVAELTERRDESKTELDQSRTELAITQRDTLALRNGQLTYRTGEEVLRVSVPPGISVWKVQNRLEALLEEAAKLAKSRGARIGFGSVREVRIPEKRLTRDDGKGIEVIDEFDSLRTASINIRKANEEVAVVVVAVSNALVGEPLFVELQTWRNPLIFHQADRLGELTLDGKKPSQEIADALYAFLKDDIRKKLLTAGTIPNGETVGEASLEAILRTLDAVRAAKSRSRITVRAARDLRAADPVALEFEVTPLGQSSFVVASPK